MNHLARDIRCSKVRIWNSALLNSFLQLNCRNASLHSSQKSLAPPKGAFTFLGSYERAKLACRIRTPERCRASLRGREAVPRQIFVSTKIQSREKFLPPEHQKKNTPHRGVFLLTISAQVGFEPKDPIFKKRSDYKNGGSRPQGEANPIAYTNLLYHCFVLFYLQKEAPCQQKSQFMKNADTPSSPANASTATLEYAKPPQSQRNCNPETLASTISVGTPSGRASVSIATAERHHDPKNHTSNNTRCVVFSFSTAPTRQLYIFVVLLHETQQGGPK